MSTDWNIVKPAPGMPETVSKTYEVIRSEPSTLADAAGLVQVYDGPIIMRTQALEEYYCLRDAYVEVAFKIASSAGAALTKRDIVTLVNGGWSLFSRAVLTIGDQTVETCSLPGKVQLATALARYSCGTVDDHASDEWIYFEDLKYRHGDAVVAVGSPTRTVTALGWAQPVDATQLTAVSGALADGRASAAAVTAYVAPIRDVDLRYNQSYAKRFFRTQESQTVTLRLPLRDIFGFCELAKPIHGLSVQLELFKNLDYPHILHGAATSVSSMSVLNSVSIWIPRVTPSKEVLLDVETALQDGAGEWVYDARTCFASPVFPSSTTRFDWNVGVLQDKPILILYGFMNQAQWGSQNDRHLSLRGNEAVGAGDVVTVVSQSSDVAELPTTAARTQNGCANGGLFSHLTNITRVAVKLNNKPYPQEQYTLDFGNEAGLSRAYFDLLDIWAKNRPEQTFPLDYDTWRESPLFAARFDDKDVASMGSAYSLHIEAQVQSAAQQAALGASGAYTKGGAGDFRCYAVVYTEKRVYVGGSGGFFKLQIA